MSKKALFLGGMFALIVSGVGAYAAGFVPTIYRQNSEIAQSSLDVNNLNFVREESHQKMTMDGDSKVLQTKMPPISMNVVPLLRSLLERVWVTKYSGTVSEIFQFSSEMPLCETLPDTQERRGDKSGAFLWKQNCLPIEIRWDVSKKDLGGTAVVRMLDFDKAGEVLEDTFEIIRTDALGEYKIKEGKKEIIGSDIKEFLDNKGIKPSFGCAHFFRTYPILEGRFYLENAAVGTPDTADEFEEAQAETERYFSLRGKRHALTIAYNPKEFVKNGNIIEYYLVLPKGFFGVEDLR